MKRLGATLIALMIALAACSSSPREASPRTAASTAPQTEDEAWEAVERDVPNVEGATADERDRFGREACDLLAAYPDDVAAAVPEVQAEFGHVTMARAGRLMLYAARWHCAEHRVAVEAWAEDVDLDTLPVSGKDEARENIRSAVAEWSDLTNVQIDRAAKRVCDIFDQHPGDLPATISAVTGSLIADEMEASVAVWYATRFDCLEHRDTVDDWVEDDPE